MRFFIAFKANICYVLSFQKNKVNMVSNGTIIDEAYSMFDIVN